MSTTAAPETLLEGLNEPQRQAVLHDTGKRVFADGTVPTALRLSEAVTYPTGTVHLAYETAGVPTYGNLAIADDH